MAVTNPQTVTRLRAATTTDRYGATVADWDNASELAIDGCRLAPETNPEVNEFGRKGVVIGWSLYRREPADIGPLDRIRTADDHATVVDTHRDAGVGDLTRHDADVGLVRLGGTRGRSGQIQGVLLQLASQAFQRAEQHPTHLRRRLEAHLIRDLLPGHAADVPQQDHRPVALVEFEDGFLDLLVEIRLLYLRCGPGPGSGQGGSGR